MNWLRILSMAISLASGIYFLICVAYAGLSTSFTVVWLGVSILAFGASWFFGYLISHEILLPVGIRYAGIVAGVLIIGAVVYAEALIIFYGKQAPPEEVEYVIVLGARVDGRRITGSLQKRLDTTIEYVKKNKDAIIIVTGGKGNGEDLSEAEAMEEYLISHGVAASSILKEERATNTRENIQYSREMIQNDDAKVAIVTNAFHMYRAISMAKAQGMTDVHGLSAPTDPILAFSYYMREAIAVLKYKLTGVI